MNKIVILALYVFSAGGFCWALVELLMAYQMGDLDSHAAELRSVELGLHGITLLGLSLLSVGLGRLLAKNER